MSGAQHFDLDIKTNSLDEILFLRTGTSFQSWDKVSSSQSPKTTVSATLLISLNFLLLDSVVSFFFLYEKIVYFIKLPDCP